MTKQWVHASAVAAFFVAAITLSQAADLAFHADAKGGFSFDTGALRGALRADGKSLGLTSVEHIPTRVRLDRSNGLLSHYRVFTQGKRYGGGAWDWPSQAELQSNGAVAVRFPAAADRPFELTAEYRWVATNAIELTTRVAARAELTGFESFLASYFSEGFTNSWICARPLDKQQAAATWMVPQRRLGDWQMYPRDTEAIQWIRDGRWKLEPNPVDWQVTARFAGPMALRRAPASGLAALLVAEPSGCFAVATPHQEEGHYSVYFSLFGRTLQTGETATARVRLVIDPAIVEEWAQGYYDSWRAGASAEK